MAVVMIVGDRTMASTSLAGTATVDPPKKKTIQSDSMPEQLIQFDSIYAK